MVAELRPASIHDLESFPLAVQIRQALVYELLAKGSEITGAHAPNRRIPHRQVFTERHVPFFAFRPLFTWTRLGDRMDETVGIEELNRLRGVLQQPTFKFFLPVRRPSLSAHPFLFLYAAAVDGLDSLRQLVGLGAVFVGAFTSHRP